MELNIGMNIKRLRLAKGLTQEQLAELLHISSAAVSKWEAKNTYPDITMLFPLANVFDVSVDELMGYDAAKMKNEIERILAEYQQLHRNGHFSEAQAAISNARKMYPNDYRVMHTYMWEKAGGLADNNPQVLLDNQEEFMQICNCILDGCTDEKLRLDALTMKAKLLHAAGNTEEALHVLEAFPDWFRTSAQKTEQLFAKDTPEFRYWVRRNLYSLLDFTANKLEKTIWYDDRFSDDEKIAQIEAIGDAFTEMRKNNGMEFFAIFERMLWACLADKMTMKGRIDDVLRIRKKQFMSIEAMTELANTDAVLKEAIATTYQTENLLQWQVDWLKNTAHNQYAKLRDNADYMALLEEYSK